MSCRTLLYCVILIGTCACDSDVLFDFPKICSIRDGECQSNVLSTFVREIGKKGIPAFKIPPLEPYEVKDTTVKILGMVDLTMMDGLVEGTTNCTFTKFETHFDERYTYTETFCDNVTISGHYKIQVGSFTQSLFGNPVSGDGIGSIQLEKITLKMKIPFSIEQIEGEIYLVPKVNDAEYSTDNVENIAFSANDIWLGDREISEPLIKFMNNNWRSLLRNFGRIFSDRVMKTFYEMLKEFFLMIPASKLVTDDLSVYV